MTATNLAMAGMIRRRRMLELFSGTGSVGNVFRERGWDVTSLDRDMQADIKADILDWDYRQFPPGHFYFIWASPPCTEYSKAKTVGVRKIEQANEVVQRTLEIIAYLSPQYYTIENPQTGYLKQQPFMSELPFKDVDYCKYGMPYRKRTRLWNNILHWCPRPLCLRDCLSMNGSRHRQTAQQRKHSSGNYEEDVRVAVRSLYKIPAELVGELVTALSDPTTVTDNTPGISGIPDSGVPRSA